jgi:hypothetical protein
VTLRWTSRRASDLPIEQLQSAFHAGRPRLLSLGAQKSMRNDGRLRTGEIEYVAMPSGLLPIVAAVHGSGSSCSIHQKLHVGTPR